MTPAQEERMKKVIAHCSGRIEAREVRPEGIIYTVRSAPTPS